MFSKIMELHVFWTRKLKFWDRKLENRPFTRRFTELRLVLVLPLIGWKSGASFLSQSCSVVMQNQLLFNTQVKTALYPLSTGPIGTLYLFMSQFQTVVTLQSQFWHKSCLWSFHWLPWRVTCWKLTPTGCLYYVMLLWEFHSLIRNCSCQN